MHVVRWKKDKGLGVERNILTPEQGGDEMSSIFVAVVTVASSENDDNLGSVTTATAAKTSSPFWLRVLSSFSLFITPGDGVVDSVLNVCDIIILTMAFCSEGEIE